MPTIGIDLGTTNSCVAVYRKDQVEIIANDQGERLTPSFVSFTEEERLIGSAAKDETSNNFENTLFQIKRLIGRRYNDPTVQADMKRWGFEIIDDDDKPMIRITQSDRRMVLCPEEVSSMILESLKKTAEDRLGEPVKDAVITVPAYFNDAQRSATRDAGTIAGLNVIRMINEPTAAAIAYGLDRQSNDDQTVLIFDLGGGTFDVTIVKIKEKIFDVLATGGDTHLGGDDFDNRMVDHFVDEFNRKNKCDMSKNKRGMNRLRVACEAAKRKLSVSSRAKVQVDGLHNGIDFIANMNRAKFEDLNLDLFENIIQTVKDVMTDARVTKRQVENIVLVGGSTRIPKVQEILEEYFEGKNMSKEINADEAVAQGAAALAAKLDSDDVSYEIGKLSLRDVTSITLGWRNCQGDMVIVLPKNTKIPTQKWSNSQTSVDYQTSLSVNVFEGERPRANDNHHIGAFTIEGIPSALRGVEKFKLCFSVNESGILTVSAQNVSTGKANQITIGSKGRLRPNEIREMADKAEKFRREDAEWKKRSEKAHELADFAYNVKHAVDGVKFKGKIADKDKEHIVRKCDDIIKWLERNKNPEIADSEQKEMILKLICRSIFQHIPGGLAFIRKPLK